MMGSIDELDEFSRAKKFKEKPGRKNYSGKFCMLDDLVSVLTDKLLFRNVAYENTIKEIKKDRRTG